MNPSELSAFKTFFTDLLSQGEKLSNQSLQDEEITGDEIDVLNQEKILHLDQRLLTRHSVYLKKVKYALEKIDKGSFGECEECGADITLARLKARPTATLCIHCKEEQEREEWHQKDKNRFSQKFSNILPINQVNKSWTEAEDKAATLSVGSQDPEYLDTAD